VLATIMASLLVVSHGHSLLIVTSRMPVFHEHSDDHRILLPEADTPTHWSPRLLKTNDNSFHYGEGRVRSSSPFIESLNILP